MKASKERLVKALTASAKAHGAEWELFEEKEQFGIYSATNPLIQDIRMICQALFGNWDMLETNTSFGCITVYLNENKFLKEADEGLLKMALPAGTDI